MKVHESCFDALVLVLFGTVTFLASLVALDRQKDDPEESNQTGNEDS
jgi:hypothetical protein